MKVMKGPVKVRYVHPAQIFLFDVVKPFARLSEWAEGQSWKDLLM